MYLSDWDAAYPSRLAERPVAGRFASSTGGLLTICIGEEVRARLAKHR